MRCEIYEGGITIERRDGAGYDDSRLQATVAKCFTDVAGGLLRGARRCVIVLETARK
jgi:hypothetical protein